MLINNKMKQHAQGNWGSDKWTKEHTEVKIPEDVEIVKHIKVKKGNKARRKYVYPGSICPHCLKELPDSQEELKKPENFIRRFLNRCKVNECPSCGAYKIEDGCPACKKDIWYSPRSSWYKHQTYSCGFEGKRKLLTN